MVELKERFCGQARGKPPFSVTKIRRENILKGYCKIKFWSQLGTTSLDHGITILISDLAGQFCLQCNQVKK